MMSYQCPPTQYSSFLTMHGSDQTASVRLAELSDSPLSQARAPAVRQRRQLPGAGAGAVRACGTGRGVPAGLPAATLGRGLGARLAARLSAAPSGPLRLGARAASLCRPLL